MRMFSLSEKWRDYCHAREDRVLEEQKRRIKEIRALLRRVPSGKALINFAEERGLHILFSKNVKGNATYGGSVVLLSPSSRRILQPLFVAHEIRHAWQEKQGLSTNKMLNVADAIVGRRFAEADAFALEAELAWQLEQDGVIPGIWKRYKREEKRIARAFENTVLSNPVTLENGTARRIAFNEWFRTGHKDSYDLNTIADARRQCENVAEGRRSYVLTDKKRPETAPARMSVEYLREFGACLDGRNFLARANTHAGFYTGRLSKANLRRVGKLAGQYEHLQTLGIASSIPTLS